MPAADDGSVCARCARHGGTCCTLRPGEEEYCFPVSAAERVAMEAAGARPEHFIRQENTPAFVANLARLFPGEDARLARLFPPRGEHDRLAILPGGACALLGPEGCLLPRGARPLYCRLFPFWIAEGRRLFFEMESCQAQRERRGGAGLEGVFGITGKDIRGLYATLRTAWGLQEKD